MWLRNNVRRLRQACEETVKSVLYRPQRDVRSDALGKIFYLLSLGFSSIVIWREKAYQKRWLRGHHLGCVVIVVGNLTVGGTGKTPIVEKLARLLQTRGRKVGILSRGYKSKNPPLIAKFFHWIAHIAPCPPKLVSDGDTIYLPVEEAGDEPLLLAKNLPGVSVVVDKDRVKAGNYAIQHLHRDLLLLDDGYQYFRLHGMFCILLIDATNPFGNGYLLPCGILREPIERMQRAQFIFLTKSAQVPAERLEALKRVVRQYNRQAPIIPCIHCPKYLQAVGGTQTLPLHALRNKKLAALSGIASPEAFDRFLVTYGAQLVYAKHFLDHHTYSQDELRAFFMQAQQSGADWVVTTEKDAVRIPNRENSALPFYFLRMEAEWSPEMDPLQQILGRISN
jgi:tetraacyldisaccharide 4'-kinase